MCANDVRTCVRKSSTTGPAHRMPHSRRAAALPRRRVRPADRHFPAAGCGCSATAARLLLLLATLASVLYSAGGYGVQKVSGMGSSHRRLETASTASMRRAASERRAASTRRASSGEHEDRVVEGLINRGSQKSSTPAWTATPFLRRGARSALPFCGALPTTGTSHIGWGVSSAV